MIIRVRREELIKNRIMSGYSQRSLSQKIGISRETLRFVLRGKNNVQTRTYNKLINWLIDDI